MYINIHNYRRLLNEVIAKRLVMLHRQRYERISILHNSWCHSMVGWTSRGIWQSAGRNGHSASNRKRTNWQFRRTNQAMRHYKVGRYWSYRTIWCDTWIRVMCHCHIIKNAVYANYECRMCIVLCRAHIHVFFLNVFYAVILYLSRITNDELT